MSYEKAIKKVEELTIFITLVENHTINSFEDLIIQQYAKYNSISMVVKNLKVNMNISHSNLTPSYIKSIILSKPKNKLHSIVKSNYLKKTRPQRRKTEWRFK